MFQTAEPRRRHDPSCIKPQTAEGVRLNIHTWLAWDRWRTIANLSSSIGARHPLLEAIDSGAFDLVCLLQQPQSRVPPRVRCQPQSAVRINPRTPPSFWDWLRLLVHVFRRLHPLLVFNQTTVNGTDYTNDGHRKVGSGARI